MRPSSLLRSASRLPRTFAAGSSPSALFRQCLSTTSTSPPSADQAAADSAASTSSASKPSTKEVRFPRSVQALYLKPLRREAEHGIPSCDLQLRSYSIRNLEFFADFALRAAYYLKLPAFGPVPLPRITERWTVPRSSFIFKKSQENFERITLRRMIQIRDGNPETVQLWLAFLQKHAYYGIGMKANVWEFSSLGVGKDMAQIDDDLSQTLGRKWEHLAQHKTLGTIQKVEELLTSRKFKTIADTTREEAQWEAIKAKQQST